MTTNNLERWVIEKITREHHINPQRTVIVALYKAGEIVPSVGNWVCRNLKEAVDELCMWLNNNKGGVGIIYISGPYKKLLHFTQEQLKSLKEKV